MALRHLFEKLPIPSLRLYTSISSLLLIGNLIYINQLIQFSDDSGHTLKSEYNTINTTNFETVSSVNISETLNAVSGTIVKKNESISAESLATNDPLSLTYIQTLFSIMISEPLSLLILVNAAYCALTLVGKSIQLVVFGTLRPIEVQRIKDKFWNYAFYKFIFLFGVLNVEDLNDIVLWLLWFSLLGFLIVFCQLCKDRFELLSVSTSVRSWELIKIIGLLNFVFCCCMSLFGLCLFGLNIGGLSVFFFMLAETVLLSLDTVYVLAKYCMHLYTLQQHQQQIASSSTAIDNSNNNETRLLIAYYCEFIFDVLTLTIDICHHLQMLLHCNIFLSMASLVVCMQLKPLIDELMQRMKRHNLYRLAMSKMEQKYPLLTKYELEEKFKKNRNYSPDEVCSICWERFEKARCLPCGHLFHQNCLRSWLEQDPSCPVCRLPLHDETSPSAPTTANVQPQPAASFNLFWPSFTVGNNARTSQQQQPQGAVGNAVPRQRNHLFRFDGSRYASWLPSFSVEVTHTHNFPFRFGRQRLSTTQLNTMVQHVRQIFPQIPNNIILNDLQRTQSIDSTINNIMDRRIRDLNILEQQADATGNHLDSSDTDSYGSSSSSNSSPSSSDVEDSDIRQTTNINNSTLSELQIDNMMNDQELYSWPLDHRKPFSDRKRQLITHMRRCYIERERSQLQTKSDLLSSP